MGVCMFVDVLPIRCFVFLAQVKVVSARQSSPVHGVHTGQRENSAALPDCARLETGCCRRQLFPTARTLQPRHKAGT